VEVGVIVFLKVGWSDVILLNAEWVHSQSFEDFVNGFLIIWGKLFLLLRFFFLLLFFLWSQHLDLFFDVWGNLH
jgi:hypothetical protein